MNISNIAPSSELLVYLIPRIILTNGCSWNWDGEFQAYLEVADNGINHDLLPTMEHTDIYKEI